MNRIKERHSHLQPKPSLVAEGGEKVETTTTTTTSACAVVGLNSGSLAPTCATTAIKNLQQEMPVEVKSRKLHVSPGDNILPELTWGLSLTSSPNNSNDGSPSRQRATNSTCSNPRTRLHFDEECTKTPIQGISKKKAVDFLTTVRVRDTPRKTDEQIRNAWYSHEEQDQFVVEAQKVVKLCRRSNMSEDDFEDEHQESTLGLDHFLNKALFKRLNRERHDVIDAVILLQEEMSARGRPIDHDLLAHACSTLSSPARERAHLVGLGHSQLSAYVLGQQSEQRSSYQCGGQDRNLRLHSSSGVAQRVLTYR